MEQGAGICLLIVITDRDLFDPYAAKGYGPQKGLRSLIRHVVTRASRRTEH